MELICDQFHESLRPVAPWLFGRINYPQIITDCGFVRSDYNGLTFMCRRRYRIKDRVPHPIDNQCAERSAIGCFEDNIQRLLKRRERLHDPLMLMARMGHHQHRFTP